MAGARDGRATGTVAPDRSGFTSPTEAKSMIKYAATLEAVRSAVRATAAEPPPISPGDRETARGLKPVVTISRQSGVGAAEVASHLVKILNERDQADTPWIEYDRQLVERVAADHNLSADLVAQLDERDRSWFEHLTAGFTGSATGTDIAMKTAKTIRALARVGRAVIIGRGGQSILANMGHVLHVRLFAPMDWRAEQYARIHGASHRDAEQALRKVDNERARYVRQHFNSDVSDGTLYDLTINMKRLQADRAAEIIAHTVLTFRGA